MWIAPSMIYQTSEVLLKTAEAAVLKCCENEKFRLRGFLTVANIRGMLFFEKTQTFCPLT